MLVLRIKLRPSGFAAGTFTHGAILLVPCSCSEEHVGYLRKCVPKSLYVLRLFDVKC